MATLAKPFVADGIPYTRAVGYGYAYLVHDATNCSANPWCHSHQRDRLARSATSAGNPHVRITSQGR